MATMVFTVVLGVVVAQFVKQADRGDLDLGSAERNERSTPRSFILPATPAVAEEQENQARELNVGVDGVACLARLAALGYDSHEPPPVLTARNVAAIVQFQRASGIAETGRLDKLTAKLLGCL
jgi:hypothetical protein